MPDAVPEPDSLLPWIERLQAGDPSARDGLIRASTERLRRLSRALLRRYPGVRRWEETDDVYQNAMMRLYRALAEVRPTDARAYLGFAALQVRRELIDLARRYAGPEGMGANHASNPGHQPIDADGLDPGSLVEWTEFHALVDRLPEELREAFDLLYYQGLSQAEAATVLGVSDRTIKRRWREARIELNRRVRGGRDASD
jgi:RNA polymerase sigma-70 factor (ECF subfamily)